jgi:hypothetical protein
MCFPLSSPNSPYRQLIDIIETVYRGASKGRGLVVSPKGAIRLVWPDSLRGADRFQQTTRHATGTKDAICNTLLFSPVVSYLLSELMYS